MKVLVIGSGGREHAICHSFAKSKRVTSLYCANGNAGIAEIAECIPISPLDVPALSAFASENAIDLTFVGGEATLALGLVDEFESRDFAIIGPTQQAAQLESSKAFAKDFMRRKGVPTARSFTPRLPLFKLIEAEREIKSGEFGNEETPLVIKADGLAAGKGVVVAANHREALLALEKMADLVGEEAAQTYVIEECLVGKEISLLMFADGEDFGLMPSTRDHKRIGEGDTGPNTGGMGTITDSSLLTEQQTDEIIKTIIRPTLTGCIKDGFPFRGILFLGLMMTADGPKLLEYNVRFGDPETQAILVRLETDLVDICEAILNGKLSNLDIKWRQGSSACVVLASKGYPSKPQTGDTIHGLDTIKQLAGVEVFHAGTRAVSSSPANAGGSAFVTAGGRVLGVTAVGDNIEAALATAYEATAHISFEGMQFRRDIGQANS